MAKKKVEEVVEAVVTEVNEYTNEFRVYTDGIEFKSFDTVEEANMEAKTNGGVVSVASVK